MIFSNLFYCGIISTRMPEGEMVEAQREANFPLSILTGK